jgi:hypothetical protein
LIAFFFFTTALPFLGDGRSLPALGDEAFVLGFAVGREGDLVAFGSAGAVGFLGGEEEEGGVFFFDGEGVFTAGSISV